MAGHNGRQHMRRLRECFAEPELRDRSPHQQPAQGNLSRDDSRRRHSNIRWIVISRCLRAAQHPHRTRGFAHDQCGQRRRGGARKLSAFLRLLCGGELAMCYESRPIQSLPAGSTAALQAGRVQSTSQKRRAKVEGSNLESNNPQSEEKDHYWAHLGPHYSSSFTVPGITLNCLLASGLAH